MNIGFASVAEVDRLWNMTGIAEACKETESKINAGQLWQMCRSGNAFLCIVHEGSNLLAASVWRFEDDGAFRCYMMNGRGMRHWVKALVSFISDIAKQNGADRLQVDGRTGWARFVQGATINGDTCEVRLDG